MRHCAHAEGRDPEEVLDRVLELRSAGLLHVRCQMGGYGGVGDGGLAATTSPQGPRTQPGRYFDPVAYVRGVPRLFDFIWSRVGFEVGLLHDVHERLAAIDAIRLTKELEPFQLFFLEDPLAPEDLGWLAEIRRQAATPIAIGELFTHPSSGDRSSLLVSSTSSAST